MNALAPSGDRDLVHAAFVVDSDAFGGAEVYTRRLLRSMPPWVRRNLVVSADVAGQFACGLPADVSTRVVPLARHSSDAPAVRVALSELSPDVVQVNLVDPGSNLACLRAALDQAPTVATLHLDGTADVASARTGYGRLPAHWPPPARSPVSSWTSGCQRNGWCVSGTGWRSPLGRSRWATDGRWSSARSGGSPRRRASIC